MQQSANNENASGGRGQQTSLSSFSFEQVKPGEGFAKTALAVVFIDLEKIEILNGEFNELHRTDKTKYPLIVGTASESEMLVPHNTPIDGCMILDVKSAQQVFATGGDKDELNKFLDNLEKQQAKTKSQPKNFQEKIIRERETSREESAIKM